MVIEEGRLEIAKTAEDKRVIRLGQPGYPAIQTEMIYRLEFACRDFSSISMNPEEWPPAPLDGRYRVDGEVHGFPKDRLATEGLSMVMLKLRETSDNRCPYFSAYYVDETVENPTEQELATKVTEVTVAKKNRGWQFALGFGSGGGGITGVTTKSVGKSVLALLASAGVGYGVGSQFEYWAVE